MRDREREVVYVQRGGDVSAKWFLWGALAGAAVALFYAPATGEQTRRGVQRRLRKLRAMAEETGADGVCAPTAALVATMDAIRILLICYCRVQKDPAYPHSLR